MTPPIVAVGISVSGVSVLAAVLTVTHLANVLRDGAFPSLSVFELARDLHQLGNQIYNQRNRSTKFDEMLSSVCLVKAKSICICFRKYNDRA